MSEIKHTQGPWRACGQRLIASAAGAGLPVCSVLPGGVGSEQADANEYLIAAAPEMLEALREARGLLWAAVASLAINDDGCIAQIDEAIEKATGGAQ